MKAMTKADHRLYECVNWNYKMYFNFIFAEQTNTHTLTCCIQIYLLIWGLNLLCFRCMNWKIDTNKKMSLRMNE